MALAKYDRYSVVTSIVDTYPRTTTTISLNATISHKLYSNYTISNHCATGTVEYVMGSAAAGYYLISPVQVIRLENKINVMGGPTQDYKATVIFQAVDTKVRGNYIDTITAENGTYPSNGVSGSYWYVNQGLANKAPTISGAANEDLSNKNTPFSIIYQVNDTDSANILNVVEKLNGNQINSISNAPRNTNFTINITKEILDSLPLNQQNTILISVTDGSATTY